MDIAALNVEVTFQKNMVVTDEVGNHKNSWEDYFTCHATVGTGTGTEATGAATVNRRRRNASMRQATIYGA